MRTMPLPEIISALMHLTGCSKELAERFLSEFENLVTDRLLNDGAADIDGIGIFRRIDTPDGASVAYIPAPALAEAVNAPFAIFDPIELDDEITGQMLDDAANSEMEPDPAAEEPATDAAGQTESTMTPSPVASPDEPAMQESSVPAPAAAATPEPEPETVEAPAPPRQPEPQPEPEPAPDKTPASVTEPSDAPAEPAGEASVRPPARQECPPEKTVTYEKVIEKETVVNIGDKSRHTLHILAASLLSLAAGLLIGYFAYDKLNLSGVRSVNISAEDVQIFQSAKEMTPGTQDIAQAPAEIPDSLPETAEAIPEEQAHTASPAEAEHPVTDTVKSNRFLTTMAQEHYGKKKFWVYIYKENEAKLDNPDKISPNTSVVIPPASKYGIRPGDKASEADAERLAQEILGKYQQ